MKHFILLIALLASFPSYACGDDLTQPFDWSCVIPKGD